MHGAITFSRGAYFVNPFRNQGASELAFGTIGLVGRLADGGNQFVPKDLVWLHARLA
jgi:hypothetical protein